jgi:ectoine hydroxylase-related dioxygenase (phytanoyl-CoA dioxygenase family)
MLDTEAIVEQLETQSFAVCDLPNPQSVLDVRDILETSLRDISGIPDITLETYHEHFGDHETHLRVHDQIASMARERKLNRHILLGQLELLKSLFGPDLAMTCRDNFRIVRPGKEVDNLGYHRDSDYGNSAYELNFLIPLVDVDEDSGLQVMPKSHLLEDEDVQLEQTKHPTITPGSVRHQLGFMHSPKIIKNLDWDKMTAPAVKVGQALTFVPHCIHGQIVNRGAVTRWSTDMEVCNALAPIQWKTTSGAPRFEVLTQSFFMREGQRKHPEQAS